MHGVYCLIKKIVVYTVFEFKLTKNTRVSLFQSNYYMVKYINIIIYKLETHASRYSDAVLMYVKINFISNLSHHLTKQILVVFVFFFNFSGRL